MELLPAELKTYIGNFMDLSTLAEFSRTNKYFNILLKYTLNMKKAKTLAASRVVYLRILERELAKYKLFPKIVKSEDKTFIWFLLESPRLRKYWASDLVRHAS